ncbi:hypothetical protein V2J09_019384 [Rumex salicifolius]
MTIITEVAEVETALAVMDASLAAIKWRLKPYAKRRLHIDVLGLCTRMRPVVMVDYGGKMPELQGHLSGFLAHAQKESAIFQKLRIMVVEDMIYMVNIDEFAGYINWSLKSGSKQVFVDLEQDPLKMVTEVDENSVAMQLISVQKFFSSIFSGSGVNYNALHHHINDSEGIAKASSSKLATSKFSEVIDLSCCLQDSQVTIPTLNGWLLFYPVVYLLGKDHIQDAVHNFAAKSLRIFKVLVCRNVSGNNQTQPEELMRNGMLVLADLEFCHSFSVPSDLSMEGRNEPWCIDFWHRIKAKRERCKHAWSSLQMEVTECYPQAIVL